MLRVREWQHYEQNKERENCNKSGAPSLHQNIEVFDFLINKFGMAIPTDQENHVLTIKI